jgi:uncharacterized membrane protein YdjX (TVP38/TMEM64 family)
MDAAHPIGASHHQKIVVIDDALAFLGGLDVTVCRWDTCDHAADEPCRVDPVGKPYGPFHDVQVAVSGPAAAALGELARDRWRRATGRLPRARGSATSDPWPEDLEPTLREVEVGIARTDPGWDGQPAAREIERLYVDAIHAAARSIYIENQYLTSTAIGDALAAALEREQGPDIAIVLPIGSSGWLEERTMGVLRTRLLRRLGEADRHGRLGVYYAHCDGLAEGASIQIHSKVCIVDDRLVTVGSANASNRSMGLDTECNLALESVEPGDAIAQRIAALREELLGEHLGKQPAEVAAAQRETGGLLAAIRRLSGPGRSLRPLELPEAGWIDGVVPEVVDPERPIEASELAERLLGGSVDGRETRSLWPIVLLLSAAALLALAWRLGPLQEWLEPQQTIDWLVSYRDRPAAILYTAALYVVAGLVMFPVTLLILHTGLVFEPWRALVHAAVGSLASAAVLWTLGRTLGRGAVRRLAGRYSNRISRFVTRRGILAMAAIRLVPIAPYSVVNLVAGASGVPFWQFLAGTSIGMAPGIVTIALVGDRAVQALRDPSWTSIGWFVGVLLVAVMLSRAMTNRIRRRLQVGVEMPRPPVS